MVIGTTKMTMKDMRVLVHERARKARVNHSCLLEARQGQLQHACFEVIARTHDDPCSCCYGQRSVAALAQKASTLGLRDELLQE
jgi:hypothetical protein